MANRWASNAAQQIGTFVARDSPCDEDIRSVFAFVRRLQLDPADAPWARDTQTGAFHARIAPSHDHDGRAVAASWTLDHAKREINFILIGHQRDNWTDWPNE